MPSRILTDIEGTTTAIAFVHRTLFPFARRDIGPAAARAMAREMAARRR